MNKGDDFYDLYLIDTDGIQFSIPDGCVHTKSYAPCI
jgi:hypothetical protein